MSKLIEYRNPHPYTVQVSGPDNKLVSIPKHGTILLSDWYLRYTPRDLQVVMIAEEGVVAQPVPVTIHVGRKVTIVPAKSSTKSVHRQTQAAATTIRTRPIIGHQAGNPVARFREALGEVYYPISNDVGVGILSFNRLPCIQKLLESIRQNTDLTRTTIFVSDESTDQTVKAWLRQQPDIVLLDNNIRLGVAGNSNRLLRCLSRFKYKLLLNDDVLVLKPGWDTFFSDKMQATGYHHFCYREAGVYGARDTDGSIREVAGNKIQTIHDKPHGSIMALDHDAFKTVGYFDEQFGTYGMEHVDWSRRVSLSGIQPNGYHDICGSEAFFKIEHTPSAVEDRGKHIQRARAIFDSLPLSGRIYVQPSERSVVPTVSYVIPCRVAEGRDNSILTVINNIKAQRFPNIEIIVSEQDVTQKIAMSNITTCVYHFTPSSTPQQPFAKAAAFNKGVVSAKTDYIILHDADILAPGHYASTIHRILQSSVGCHIGKQVLYLTRQATDEVNKSQHVDANKHCDTVVDYFVGGSLAIRRTTYMTIGGFDANFVGYGVEDVEFFNRLKHHHGSFYDERSINVIHLWHDRSSNWQACHAANKQYATSIENIAYAERYRILKERLHR